MGVEHLSVAYHKAETAPEALPYKERSMLLLRAREHLSAEEVEELRDAMIRGDLSAVAAWKTKIDGTASVPEEKVAETSDVPRQSAAILRPAFGRSRPTPAFRAPHAAAERIVPAATPVSEHPTSVESPAASPESIAVPDAATLRATVEEIREEISAICNSLTLVLCEEYTREYLPIYHDIQQRFSHGELSPDDLLSFAQRVEDLKGAAVSVAEKMGVLEQSGSPQSIFGDREVRVPVTEVTVPPIETSPAMDEVRERPAEESSSIAPLRSGVHDIVRPAAGRVEAIDDLHTPDMDRRLDELLKDWLGRSGGFLGMGGVGGRTHPEFVALRDQPMERIMRNDYAPEVRAAVSKKTLRSIERNMEAWQQHYGVVADPAEDFEQYVRRVIAASAQSERETA